MPHAAPWNLSRRQLRALRLSGNVFGSSECLTFSRYFAVDPLGSHWSFSPELRGPDPVVPSWRESDWYAQRGPRLPSRPALNRGGGRVCVWW